MGMTRQAADRIVADAMSVWRRGAFDRMAGPERVNALKKKYPELALVIDELAKLDPTGGQQKYLDWAARASRNVEGADLAGSISFQAGMVAVQVMDVVARWHEVQKFIGKEDLDTAGISKDINQYKTVDDLTNAVEKVEKAVVGPLRVKELADTYKGSSVITDHTPDDPNYALREMARLDPSGTQEYLAWGMDQLYRGLQREWDFETFKVTQEATLNADSGNISYHAKVGDLVLAGATDRGLVNIKTPMSEFVAYNSDWSRFVGDAGLQSYTAPLGADEIKARVKQVADVYGRYDRAQMTSEAYERITGEQIPDLYSEFSGNRGADRLAAWLDKNAVAIDVAAPEVLKETENFTAYGPIVDKAQLCDIGHGTEWCTASWASREFEGYMDREGEDPHFVVIVRNEDQEKYLAFVTDGKIQEFRDSEDKRAKTSDFDEVLQPLGLRPKPVTVYYVRLGEPTARDDERKLTSRNPADLDALLESDNRLFYASFGYGVYRGTVDSEDWFIDGADGVPVESEELLREVDGHWQPRWSVADLRTGADWYQGIKEDVERWVAQNSELVGAMGCNIWSFDTNPWIDATGMIGQRRNLELVDTVAARAEGHSGDVSLYVAVFPGLEDDRWLSRREDNPIAWAATPELLTTQPHSLESSHRIEYGGYEVRRYTITAGELALYYSNTQRIAAEESVVDGTRSRIEDTVRDDDFDVVERVPVAHVSMYFVTMDGEPRSFENTLEKARQAFDRAVDRFDDYSVRGYTVQLVSADVPQRIYSRRDNSAEKLFAAAVNLEVVDQWEENEQQQRFDLTLEHKAPSQSSTPSQNSAKEERLIQMTDWLNAQPAGTKVRVNMDDRYVYPMSTDTLVKQPSGEWSFGFSMDGEWTEDVYPSTDVAEIALFSSSSGGDNRQRRPSLNIEVRQRQEDMFDESDEFDYQDLPDRFNDELFLGHDLYEDDERQAFLRVAGPERVEALKKKYPELAGVVDYLAAIDPSGGQQKYLDWAVRIVRQAGGESLMARPLARWHAAQKFIGREQLGTKGVNKDINSYKTLDDLVAAVEQVEEAAKGLMRVDAAYAEWGPVFADMPDPKYPVREFARADPSGQQDYLEWALTNFKDEIGLGEVSTIYEVVEPVSLETRRSRIPLEPGAVFYARYVQDGPLRADPYYSIEIPGQMSNIVVPRVIQQPLSSGKIVDKGTRALWDDAAVVKQTIQEIANLYGKYHQLQDKAEAIERITGEPLTDISQLDSGDLQDYLAEIEPVIMDVTPPAVAYEDDDFTAYGPITDKAQMCAYGTEEWCVARWSSTYFESTTYMGDESGDPHFIMIVSEKNPKDKWLAFIRGGGIEEFRDRDDDVANPHDFDEIFGTLEIGEGSVRDVMVYYVQDIHGEGPFYVNQSLAHVQRAAADDIDLTSYGYTIWSAVANADEYERREDDKDLDHLEMEDDTEIEGYAGESVTRYFVSPFGEDLDDPQEAVKYAKEVFEDEEDARYWVEDEDNADTIAAAGWMIWSGETTEADLQNSQFDELPIYNAAKIDDAAPDETVANVEHTVYVAVVTNKHTHRPEALMWGASIADVKPKTNDYQATQYGDYSIHEAVLSAQNIERLRHVPRHRLPQEMRSITLGPVIEYVPPVMNTVYFVLVDGIPINSSLGQASAQVYYDDAVASRSVARTVQLVEATAPARLVFYDRQESYKASTNRKVIQQSTPNDEPQTVMQMPFDKEPSIPAPYGEEQADNMTRKLQMAEALRSQPPGTVIERILPSGGAEQYTKNHAGEWTLKGDPNRPVNMHSLLPFQFRIVEQQHALPFEDKLARLAQLATNGTITLFHGGGGLGGHPGRFGEFTFFSASMEAAESHGDKLYTLEVDPEQIFEPYMFRDADPDVVDSAVSDIQAVLSVDEDVAYAILLEQDSGWGHPTMTADADWDFQQLRAEAALQLGYPILATEDEHGTSYMVHLPTYRDRLQLVDKGSVRGGAEEAGLDNGDSDELDDKTAKRTAEYASANVRAQSLSALQRVYELEYKLAVLRGQRLSETGDLQKTVWESELSELVDRQLDYIKEVAEYWYETHMPSGSWDDLHTQLMDIGRLVQRDNTMTRGRVRILRDYRADIARNLLDIVQALTIDENYGDDDLEELAELEDVVSRAIYDAEDYDDDGNPVIDNFTWRAITLDNEISYRFMDEAVWRVDGGLTRDGAQRWHDDLVQRVAAEPANTRVRELIDHLDAIDKSAAVGEKMVALHRAVNTAHNNGPLATRAYGRNAVQALTQLSAAPGDAWTTDVERVVDRGREERPRHRDRWSVAPSYVDLVRTQWIIDQLSDAKVHGPLPDAAEMELGRAQARRPVLIDGYVTSERARYEHDCADDDACANDSEYDLTHEDAEQSVGWSLSFDDMIPAEDKDALARLVSMPRGGARYLANESQDADDDDAGNENLPYADPVFDPETPWHIRQLPDGTYVNAWTGEELTFEEAMMATPPEVDLGGKKRRDTAEEKLKGLLTPEQVEDLKGVKKLDKERRVKPEDAYQPEHVVPKASDVELDLLGVTPRGGVDNILAVLSHARPDQVRYWKNWYRHANHDAKELAKKWSTPVSVVAGVISATSPNTRWEENIFAAEQMLRGAGKDVIKYRRELDEEAAKNWAARIYPDLYMKEKKTLGAGVYLDNITKAQRIIDSGKVSVDQPINLSWNPADQDDTARAEKTYNEKIKAGWTARTTKTRLDDKSQKTKSKGRTTIKPPSMKYKHTWQPSQILPIDAEFPYKERRLILRPTFLSQRALKSGPNKGKIKDPEKTTAFYESIRSPKKHRDTVVLDGHAINIWRGKPVSLSKLKSPTVPERENMIADYKSAAAQSKETLAASGVRIPRDLEPQQVQAITWTVWRDAVKGAGISDDDADLDEFENEIDAAGGDGNDDDDDDGDRTAQTMHPPEGYEPCPENPNGWQHYVDNQGLCHYCGELMDRGLWEDYAGKGVPAPSESKPRQVRHPQARVAYKSDPLGAKMLKRWFGPEGATVTIMSAALGALSISKKKKRQLDLLEDLRGLDVEDSDIVRIRGQWTEKVNGVDDTKSEPSVAVHGLSFEQALALARKYDQESFIFKDLDGAIGMYYGYRKRDREAGIDPHVTIPTENGKPVFGADAIDTASSKELISGGVGSSFALKIDWGNPASQKIPVSLDSPLTQDKVYSSYVPKEQPEAPSSSTDTPPTDEGEGEGGEARPDEVFLETSPPGRDYGDEDVSRNEMDSPPDPEREASYRARLVRRAAVNVVDESPESEKQLQVTSPGTGDRRQDVTFPSDEIEDNPSDADSWAPMRQHEGRLAHNGQNTEGRLLSVVNPFRNHLMEQERGQGGRRFGEGRGLLPTSDFVERRARVVEQKRDDGMKRRCRVGHDSSLTNWVELVKQAQALPGAPDQLKLLEAAAIQAGADPRDPRHMHQALNDLEAYAAEQGWTDIAEDIRDLAFAVQFTGPIDWVSRLQEMTQDSPGAAPTIERAVSSQQITPLQAPTQTPNPITQAPSPLSSNPQAPGTQAPADTYRPQEPAETLDLEAERGFNLSDLTEDQQGVPGQHAPYRDWSQSYTNWNQFESPRDKMGVQGYDEPAARPPHLYEDCRRFWPASWEGDCPSCHERAQEDAGVPRMPEPPEPFDPQKEKFIQRLLNRYEVTAGDVIYDKRGDALRISSVDEDVYHTRPLRSEIKTREIPRLDLDQWLQSGTLRLRKSPVRLAHGLGQAQRDKMGNVVRRAQLDDDDNDDAAEGWRIEHGDVAKNLFLDPEVKLQVDPEGYLERAYGVPRSTGIDLVNSLDADAGTYYEFQAVISGVEGDITAAADVFNSPGDIPIRKVLMGSPERETLWMVGVTAAHGSDWMPGLMTVDGTAIVRWSPGRRLLGGGTVPLDAGQRRPVLIDAIGGVLAHELYNARIVRSVDTVSVSVDVQEVESITRQAQKQPWVAVDLDGTVLEALTDEDDWAMNSVNRESGEDHQPALKPPLPGAQEALAELMGMGWRVSIYTARFSSDLAPETIARYQAEIEDHLESYDIPYSDIWVGMKPRADYYIDDKAVEFDGDWTDILSHLTVADPTDGEEPDTAQEPELDMMGVALPDTMDDNFENSYLDYDETRHDRSIPRSPALEELQYPNR